MKKEQEISRETRRGADVVAIDKTRLRESVATALAVAGGFDAFHIRVTAERDRIILSGTVSTAPEITRAMIVAETAAGSYPISSRIAVR